MTGPVDRILSMASPFTERVKQLLRQIPPGRVCTYGYLAQLAGSPRGARQVVHILHTCAQKERLPWHRIVNRYGEIALPRGKGFERQRALLLEEGIEVSVTGRIDLDTYLWHPGTLDRP